MAHDIFISYATDAPHSNQAANGIVHELESRGIRCWIAPRDMSSGVDYMGQLSERVPESKALVLVFSSEANGSPHIKREVALAFENEVPILPFRVEDVKPARELSYCIGHIHWLDALDPPLTRHIEALADRVEQIVEEGPGDQVALIRQRKDDGRLWPAVVWSMKHGVAATVAVLAVLVGLAGTALWSGARALERFVSGGGGAPPTLPSPTVGGIPANRAAQAGATGASAPTPDELAEAVVAAVVCQGGMCAFNRLGGLPSAIGRIRYGEDPDELDRFVDLERERRLESETQGPIGSFYVVIDPRADPIYFQVETTDGARSDPKPARVYSRTDQAAPVARLEPASGPEDFSDPGVYMSLSSLGQSTIRLSLGSPSDVAALRYAFDEGGFFEEPVPSIVRGRPYRFALDMPESAATLRLAFELRDGGEAGPFRYRIPRLADAQAESGRTLLEDRIASRIQCVRVGPPPTEEPATPEAWEERRRVFDEAFQAIFAAGIDFLIDGDARTYEGRFRGAPALVCLPKQPEFSSGESPADWLAAERVTLRNASGHDTTIAIVAPSSDVASAWGRPADIWKATLPIDSREIYARVGFRDGVESDEVRIAIQEIPLGGSR